MEKYLGIYNNNSAVAIEKINFDNNIDLDNLKNEEYEQADTIEELEKMESDKKFLHLFEYTENEDYKYITTKIIK